MSNRCPQCSRPLDPFAVSCTTCGWQLLEDIESRGEMENRDLIHSSYDLYYRSTLRLLEEHQFEAAIREANRTISVADPTRLGSARALRGYVYLTVGDPSSADADLTEAINRGHQEPDVLAWRAAARARLDRWREVFEDLAEAIAILDEPDERYRQMLLAHRADAMAFFQKELENDPRQSLRLRDRGWAHYYLGELTEAITDFQAALEIDAEEGMARAGMAMTLLRQGNFLDAIEASQSMIHDPRPYVRRWGWECLARGQHGAGLYAECRNSLDYLRSLAGSQIPQLMAVGRLRAELGDLSTAIGDFTDVIEMDASSGEPALLARAQCYERMRSLHRALDDYSHFLRRQPGHLPSRLRRAKLNARLGRDEPALEDLAFVLELDPRNISAWVEQAEIHLRLEQLDRAADACQQAMQVDNRHWRLCLTMGRVQHRMQRYSEAAEHFSRAIDVGQTPQEKAESLFARAQSQILLEQWDQAALDLERAASQIAQDPGIWLTLASVYTKRDEWDNAANCLLRAMQVTPQLPANWRGLGQHIAEGIVAQATRALQRGQQDPKVFRRRAHALSYLNRLTESLADCDSVLATAPLDKELRIRRSMVLHQLGEYDAALKDLTRVLRQDPNNHYARFLRARTLVQTEDYDAALSDLNKAIAVDPRVAKYHLLRGEVQRRRGKLTKAIRAFGRAQMIQPGDVRPLQLRAEACMQAGYPAESVRDLSRAHEIEPENPEFLTLRGQALLALEQWDQAMEDFEEAVRLKSENPRSYTGRAMALLRKSRHQEALIWLTKAVHRFGDERDQAHLFLMRGRVFTDMGRPSMAIADYSAVLKRMPAESPSAAQVRLLRAIAWIRDGQFYAAERDLKKVRRLLGKNSLADKLWEWVRNRDQPMPTEISADGKIKQLQRPPKIRDGVPVNRDDDRWLVAPPYDMWILKDVQGDEYGPVSKLTLDQWTEQGRIDQGMKLLRSDWSKWKKAEKVFGELRAPG